MPVMPAAETLRVPAIFDNMRPGFLLTRESPIRSIVESSRPSTFVCCWRASSPSIISWMLTFIPLVLVLPHLCNLCAAFDETYTERAHPSTFRQTYAFLPVFKVLMAYGNDPAALSKASPKIPIGDLQRAHARVRNRSNRKSWDLRVIIPPNQ